MEKRQRFVQDDDGHWYLIYAEQVQMFEQWVVWMNGNGPDPHTRFEFNRLAGSPSVITFVDPQED